MKLSLQLRIGQHLTMTPQLQQAIHLLQLSTPELEAAIEEALETNPLLERNDRGEETEDAVSEPEPEVDAEPNDSGTLPEALATDDLDAPYTSAVSATADPDSGAIDRARPESLQDHLLAQLRLTRLSETDQGIAMILIDALDADGYLREPLAELRAGVVGDALEPSLDVWLAVLHTIQQFDPVGVGARDLRECLRLQLAALPADTRWLAEAKTLVDEHLSRLGTGDLTAIARRMQIDDVSLGAVMALLRTLNPRPGAAFANLAADYVIPDLYVYRQGGTWRLELNPDRAAPLRLHEPYLDLIRRGGGGAEVAYLRRHLQEARWFLKSLEHRDQTLLRVGAAIVERQQAFLERGDAALRPLIMQEIAEVLGLHESTVSSATNRKYLHTPRGVFELKSFFSNGVPTLDGGLCAATAIRAMLRELIGSEDPARPLTDSQLAGIFRTRGIAVARRTVAKYREILKLPPAPARRRRLGLAQPVAGSIPAASV